MPLAFARLVALLCSLGLGLVGCAKAPADPTGGPGDPGGGGTGGSDVVPHFDRAFDAAVHWSAPDRVVGLDFSTSQGDALVDMDGDGRPDLVIVGDDRRLFDGSEGLCIHVHRNTGSGFGAAERWTLPSGIESFVWYPLQDDVRLWRLADVDGDGRADLLVTSEGQRQDATPMLGGAGDPHWLAYRNTGTGFERQGTKLSLPPEMLPFLAALESRIRYGGAAPLRLIDLDGDGIRDYVATWDVDAGALPGGEDAPHWVLFRGDGSSFHDGVAWAVPAGGDPSGGFFDLEWNWRDGTEGPGSQAWMLRDLDGDGGPDLLVFAEKSSEAGWIVPGWPGDPHWILHPNTGNGFGPARKIRLPAQVDVSALSGVWDGNRAASLLDMDGDGRLDLVVPKDTSASAPRWLTFLQEDDGSFAEVPVVWAIPPDPDRPGDHFPWTSGSAWRFCAIGAPDTCEGGVQQWMTLDLDGDGRADLVEWDFTERRNVPGGPKAPHLRVYLNPYSE